MRINGLVQGVGFRPHVWRLATELGLMGHVLNDGAGVEIDVWGTEPALDRLLDKLKSEAPPLARVDSVTWEPLYSGPSRDGFDIIESAKSVVSTGVVPDAATCPDCLDDIASPADRRHGYAFTNCTHCGPRLSIVRAIPYDRANTSMGAFAMCPACAAEYADPADRRFHAQPTACPACGPRVWLEDRAGRVQCDDPIAETARHLANSAIAAIKGIGGFHLACDATRNAVVAELRRRKRRLAKPLAVMARDVEQLRRYCRVTEEEEGLLRSPAAPIVLLEIGDQPLAEDIAPGHDRIGVMLPYSPLHHLLMAKLDVPIVLTSGNLSDDPQTIGNEDARERLAGIADIWLMYDRDIVNRLDDSVMRLDAPGPQILRRARGLAPAPLALPDGFSNAPPVLALGGELKSTFCLLKDGQAILSQHMGDLEKAAVHVDFRHNVRLYRDLFRLDPEVVAVDCHPDYMSTRCGEMLVEETGAHIVQVQHHHAHLAGCLADNSVAVGDDMSVGIVLDGLGLGTDDTLWGGEILVGGYGGFERAAHFAPVPMPGAAQAAREPWRNLVSHLQTAFGTDWRRRVAGTAIDEMLADKPVDLIAQMAADGINAPLSSSAGRLFDAVAAALGICATRQHYEGHAALLLEALAGSHRAGADIYPVDVARTADAPPVLSWAPLWEALIADLKKGTDHGVIAARFHAGLSEGVSGIAKSVAQTAGLNRIALSGGVMQNRILLESLFESLSRDGLEVVVHKNVPANDGGLALGQAVVAASQKRA